MGLEQLLENQGEPANSRQVGKWSLKRRMYASERKIKNLV